MNKPLTLGFLGLGFYLGFLWFDFVEFAGGGWLDTYGPYLAFMPILSLFFIFASVSVLKLNEWRGSFLNLCATMTVIFGFPNISFPVGSTYFETIQKDFGHLSLFMGFFTLILYVHFYGLERRA